MAEGPREQGSGIDGYLFRLIATFEAAAMQQLGKIAHPVTGDVEVNLDGARDSIEMLAMVQRKTAGNLNDDEGGLLQHVLYQLRMNYVDVARAEEEAGAPGAESSGDAAGAGAGAESAGDSASPTEGQTSAGDPKAAGAESAGDADDAAGREEAGGSNGAEADPEPPRESGGTERDDDR